ncbi:MAG: NAD(+) diphosphatase [Erysipelotrichaceae bacterium]|jgi:NAD+ diphosphatase|nr:NAD(+) diphosphatase [Erysipelotrichaceae bacterium]
MYQDIAPHIYDNHYHPCPPSAGDIILGYEDNQILMKEDGTFLHYEECRREHSFQYLFAIDQIHFYLSDLSEEDAMQKVSYRAMRTYEPSDLAFAAVTGWQLYQWYRDQKYCGKCGEEMHPDTAERAMRCPKCGNLVYPKIMPAVIVGIRNEKGQILLTKYANRPYTKFALVAGFAEIGETIEETVKREVKEETDLDVTDLTFYKSQPWSFSSTLLFGFWAHADSHQPIIMDDGELKEAGWYDRDVNVDNLDQASLTAEMIRMYKKGRD